MAGDAAAGLGLDAAAARQAVDRVIASGVLGQNSRLPALLRHVVEEELEGRGERIKAYSIGTGVLGRPDSFDPSVDSIVRVEFRRLRQALDHYYATQGANETLVIDVPGGGYRTVFIAREVDAGAASSLMPQTAFNP